MPSWEITRRHKMHLQLIVYDPKYFPANPQLRLLVERPAQQDEQLRLQSQLFHERNAARLLHICLFG